MSDNPTRALFLKELAAIDPKLADLFERDAQIVNLGGLMIEISGNTDEFMAAVQDPMFALMLDRVLAAMGFEDESVEVNLTDKPNPYEEEIRRHVVSLIPILERMQKASAWLGEKWDLDAGQPIGVSLATYEEAARRFQGIVRESDAIAKKVENLGGKVDFPKLYGVAWARLEKEGFAPTKKLDAVSLTKAMFSGREVDPEVAS